LQFDDSLDTFPVHGVGGTVGAILTGIFATKAVNSAGDNGLLFGNPAQLWEQIVGVVVTYIFAGIGTFVILKLLSFAMDLRISLHWKNKVWIFMNMVKKVMERSLLVGLVLLGPLVNCARSVS
jgi:ammonia channel protein AmtB